MQTDVLASGVRTTSGQLADQAGNNLGRNRIKAIYIVPAAGAGSVVFKDGGASGTTRLTINTLAASTAPEYMLLPGEGIVFQTDIYVSVTTIGSVMVFYA
jgi:uncharacterized metal-binding protein